MKLVKYLNERIEEISDEEIIKIVQRDCKRFLDNNPGTEYALYSGRNKSNKFIKNYVRKDREPLSMKKQIHDKLNNIFKEAYGVNLRSESVFCSRDIDVAGGYGNLYMIFPIGEYQLYWSDIINDLYMDLGWADSALFSLERDESYFTLYHLIDSNADYKTTINQLHLNIRNKKGERLNNDEILKYVEDLKEKIDKDKNFRKEQIRKLYNTSKKVDKKIDRAEIMLVCDEYYGLLVEDFDDPENDYVFTKIFKGK